MDAPMCGRLLLAEIEQTSTPPRHTAIFAGLKQLGVIGRVARTKQMFGRDLPAHELAERQRVRSDALLD